MKIVDTNLFYMMYRLLLFNHVADLTWINFPVKVCTRIYLFLFYHYHDSKTKNKHGMDTIF